MCPGAVPPRSGGTPTLDEALELVLGRSRPTSAVDLPRSSSTTRPVVHGNHRHGKPSPGRPFSATANFSQNSRDFDSTYRGVPTADPNRTEPVTPLLPNGGSHGKPPFGPQKKNPSINSTFRGTPRTENRQGFVESREQFEQRLAEHQAKNASQNGHHENANSNEHHTQSLSVVRQNTLKELSQTINGNTAPVITAETSPGVDSSVKQFVPKKWQVDRNIVPAVQSSAITSKDVADWETGFETYRVDNTSQPVSASSASVASPHGPSSQIGPSPSFFLHRSGSASPVVAVVQPSVHPPTSITVYPISTSVPGVLPETALHEKTPPLFGDMQRGDFVKPVVSGVKPMVDLSRVMKALAGGDNASDGNGGVLRRSVSVDQLADVGATANSEMRPPVHPSVAWQQQQPFVASNQQQEQHQQFFGPSTDHSVASEQRAKQQQQVSRPTVAQPVANQQQQQFSRPPVYPSVAMQQQQVPLATIVKKYRSPAVPLSEINTLDDVPIDDSSSVSSLQSDIPVGNIRSVGRGGPASHASSAPAMPKSILKKRPSSVPVMSGHHEPVGFAQRVGSGGARLGSTTSSSASLRDSLEVTKSHMLLRQSQQMNGEASSNEVNFIIINQCCSALSVLASLLTSLPSSLN